MKLDPRHLEILAAVVDHGGVGEAAVALGKSQPSLSRSLALLEQRVGTALFVANRRPLIATEFCLALAQQGRQISAAGAAADELVARFSDGHSGAVRLAGSPFLMDGVVSKVLANFQFENPSVHIDQHYGYVPEVISGLQSGALDLGILPIRNREIPPNLDFVQILPGRNVVACRFDHPLAGKALVRLSDISACAWIAPPGNSPLYHDLRAVLGSIGVQDFKISFRGGSLSTVVNILSGSDALTVLPYSVVFMLKRQHTLSALPIRIGDPDRNLGILSRQPQSPATTRLSNYITTAFATLRQLIQRQEQNELWGR